jgi:hypothetical protein
MDRKFIKFQLAYIRVNAMMFKSTGKGMYKKEGTRAIEYLREFLEYCENPDKYFVDDLY